MFKIYFVYKTVKSFENERVTAVVHEILGQPSYIRDFCFKQIPGATPHRSNHPEPAALKLLIKTVLCVKI